MHFSADEMLMHSLASIQTVQPYELVCARAEQSRCNYAQISWNTYVTSEMFSPLCCGTNHTVDHL